MMLAVPVVLFEMTLALSASDRMPVFDVKPGCTAATSLMSLDPKRQKLCLVDEATARAAVAKQWSRFPAGDRTRCSAEAQLDGTPSYVELLECLTLAREAAASDTW